MFRHERADRPGRALQPVDACFDGIGPRGPIEIAFPALHECEIVVDKGDDAGEPGNEHTERRGQEGEVQHLPRRNEQPHADNKFFLPIVKTVEPADELSRPFDDAVDERADRPGHAHDETDHDLQDALDLPEVLHDDPAQVFDVAPDLADEGEPHGLGQHPGKRLQPGKLVQKALRLFGGGLRIRPGHGVHGPEFLPEPGHVVRHHGNERRIDAKPLRVEFSL